MSRPKKENRLGKLLRVTAAQDNELRQEAALLSMRHTELARICLGIGLDSVRTARKQAGQAALVALSEVEPCYSK